MKKIQQSKPNAVKMRVRFQQLALILFLCGIGADPAYSQFGPRPVASPEAQLGFRIEIDGKEFTPRQPIIVTSILSNVGKAKVSVPEPSALAFVVSLAIAVREGTGTKVISPRKLGAGGPAWSAALIDLEPKQSVQRDSELFRSMGEMDLPPGRYIIQAKYHQYDYFTPEYVTKAIAAEAEFTIVEPSEAEKAVLAKLDAALSVQTEPERKTALREFLKEHPKSVFRVRALDELFLLEYQTQSWRELVEVLRQLRQEPISSAKRELMMYQEADSLIRLGEDKEAIKILADAQSIQSIALRKELEAKVQGLQPKTQ